MEAAGTRTAPVQKDQTRSRMADMRRWTSSHPEVILLMVLAVSLFFRVLKLNEPDRLTLFDERYYVNAARTILGLPRPSGVPYELFPGGKDPNLEHPPLGKLLIAASIGGAGDNPLGWRL